MFSDHMVLYTMLAKMFLSKKHTFVHLFALLAQYFLTYKDSCFNEPLFSFYSRHKMYISLIRKFCSVQKLRSSHFHAREKFSTLILQKAWWFSFQLSAEFQTLNNFLVSVCWGRWKIKNRFFRQSFLIYFVFFRKVGFFWIKAYRNQYQRN